MIKGPLVSVSLNRERRAEDAKRLSALAASRAKEAEDARICADRAGKAAVHAGQAVATLGQVAGFRATEKRETARAERLEREVRELDASAKRARRDADGWKPTVVTEEESKVNAVAGVLAASGVDPVRAIQAAKAPVSAPRPAPAPAPKAKPEPKKPGLKLGGLVAAWGAAAK